MMGFLKIKIGPNIGEFCLRKFLLMISKNLKRSIEVRLLMMKILRILLFCHLSFKIVKINFN